MHSSTLPVPGLRRILSTRSLVSLETRVNFSSSYSSLRTGRNLPRRRYHHRSRPRYLLRRSSHHRRRPNTLPPRSCSHLRCSSQNSRNHLRRYSRLRKTCRRYRSSRLFSSPPRKRYFSSTTYSRACSRRQNRRRTIPRSILGCFARTKTTTNSFS